MNILQLIATVALFWTTADVTFAAPRDQINPATIKDKVSLKLGVKGTIQFKVQGDILREPKLVKDAPDNAEGVGAELSKSDNLTMLSVQNRFAKNLHYRAAIRLKGQTDFVETSLIPVKAGLLSFESWGDPIEEIILFEFKLTDKKL